EAQAGALLEHEEAAVGLRHADQAVDHGREQGLRIALGVDAPRDLEQEAHALGVEPLLGGRRVGGAGLGRLRIGTGAHAGPPEARGGGGAGGAGSRAARSAARTAAAGRARPPAAATQRATASSTLLPSRTA